ncbi:sensor histidine kinase [Spirosoma fluviale]|uniref:histidine kinase n=1 Tax=Spirosoma fluviale TaxID=1597977 RepID=A0A286FGU8_9BACT|nr:7TM diverse intracellular signaling domain-containing protein [Spirosoma fluviale]SOD82467.1 His Kinase A (phospho-acceptor) domain-containing protein [Spirosoma fluviale]
MGAIIRLGGFVILYLLFLQGKSQSVFLRNPLQTYDLFRQSLILEVQPGRITIDSLLQHPNRYPFTPTENQKIRPDDYQRAYWFRIDLTNPTTDPFFLHFVYSGTERIDVYEVANNRIINRQHLGRLVAEPQEPFRYSKLIYPLQIQNGQTHTLYIYMQGIYTTCLYFNARSTINLLGTIHREDLFYGLYYGFILIIIVYSLLLFIRLGDRDTLLYAIWVLSVGVQLGLYRGFTAEFLWSANPSLERYGSAVAGLTGFLHVLFTLYFLRLRQRARRFYLVGLVAIGAYLLSTILFVFSVYWGNGTGRTIDLIPLMALAEGIFSIVTAFVIYRQGFKPALFYLVGNLVFFVSIFVFLQYAYGFLPHLFWTYNSIHIGSGFEIILFTLALSYKVNLLKKKQDEAIREQLRLSEDNRQLVETQNVVLEQKVQERTQQLNARQEELKTTLKELQSTQTQLIQKEKLASLGQLMTGIAHEIQNPLNLVNNFSELGEEIVLELQAELKNDQSAPAQELFGQLELYLQKITHHGKRASSIVRSMLEHSRSSSGAKQNIDLNALVQDYFNLTYRSTKANTSGTPIQLHTDFDPTIVTVSVMHQELSRVLINLFTNAFYTVLEKAERVGKTYEPQVWVSTQRFANSIQLVIKDNGRGIPPAIIEKIYQPFFTTKPTGQGIGLGLSLSYDIITKGHDGTITVNSEVDTGTEFIIDLPLFKPDQAKK